MLLSTRKESSFCLRTRPTSVKPAELAVRVTRSFYFEPGRNTSAPSLRSGMATLPLQDYGVIGDLHTVALVGTNGSIDWWCFPHFDSASVFGALLDDDKGGRFQIAPVLPCEHKQLYLPDTNVLVTR